MSAPPEAELNDVLAVGEVMGLLDPAREGPLENAGPFTLRVAGAEANVLIGLSRLGHRTSLVSAVGADPIGRLILRTLREQGIAVDHVYRDDAAQTGIFFKERRRDGQRRVYYYRDGSAASRLTADTVGLHRLPPPAVLVVSGISLALGGPGGLGGVATEAIRRFSAAGTTVVFDANVRARLWDGEQAARDFALIRPYVDILLAGRDELVTLVPKGTPEEAAASLCAEGLRAVAAKDGARGAVLYEASGATVIPPYPVERVVDPVGAGDAFAAGLICGLLRGWPLSEGAALGALLGAAAVTTSGDWEHAPVAVDPARLLRKYQEALR